jgi:hypothetical protein
MITNEQLQQTKQVFEMWMGITPERHHQIIYQRGLKRISLQTVPGSMYAKKLEASAQWWSWWQRDWNTKNLTAMLNVGINPYEPPTFIEITTVEALREALAEQHATPTFSKPILKEHLKTI